MPSRAPDRVRYALTFASRRFSDRRPALLTLDDELLTKIGASLAPEIDDETPGYGCLGVNRRLRELWRPFVCSRLRLLSARPAATLTVDSDAMEEAALKEVDDQLTEAARVHRAAPRVPGQKS